MRIWAEPFGAPSTYDSENLVSGRSRLLVGNDHFELCLGHIIGVRRTPSRTVIARFNGHLRYDKIV